MKKGGWEKVTPWCENEIESEDRELFKKIEKIIEHLPDLSFGWDRDNRKIIISCHLLARAIYEVLPEQFISVATGKFMKYFDHSWLITARGNILDVYPVGCLGGPILHYGVESGPVFFMFDKDERVDITNGIGRERFEECLVQLVEKIKEII